MNVIALDQPSKNCEGDRIVQEAELCLQLPSYFLFSSLPAFSICCPCSP